MTEDPTVTARDSDLCPAISIFHSLQVQAPAEFCQTCRQSAAVMELAGGGSGDGRLAPSSLAVHMESLNYLSESESQVRRDHRIRPSRKYASALLVKLPKPCQKRLKLNSNYKTA
jgi:hypothetical protein